MKRVLRAALIAGTFSVLASVSAAQQYPARTVTIIGPFPPASGLAVPARLVAGQLSPALGRSFGVENKNGAGGNTAAAFVA